MRKWLRHTGTNDDDDRSPRTTSDAATPASSHVLRLRLFSKVQVLSTRSFKFPSSMPVPTSTSSSVVVARTKPRQPQRKKLFLFPFSLQKPTQMLSKLLQTLPNDPFGVADKMRAIAKRLWFTRAPPPTAASDTGTAIDVEAQLRAWAALARANVAKLIRRKQLRDYAVHEALAILDATVHTVLWKAKMAADRRHLIAALCIQHAWRSYAGRRRKRSYDKRHVLATLRSVVERMLCARLVPRLVAEILAHGCSRMAIRTIQRVWRGHKGRQRARLRRRRVQKEQRAAAREIARLAKRRALLAPPENGKRLESIKRTWARDDFVPSPHIKPSRLLPRHKTLHPLPTQTPPESPLIAKLSVPKWTRLQKPVRPNACWVAVPIHVTDHAHVDNLRPQSRLLKRHYDLQYDWVPAGLLQSTTDVPAPITFEDKVRRLMPPWATSVPKDVRLQPLLSKPKLHTVRHPSTTKVLKRPPSSSVRKQCFCRRTRPSKILPAIYGF
ncbi:hypothetical protein SDRG_05882 [Saprolegnia diclina VS20]|uniref:IQ calmodulin-binding motif domain-containing protein n=1 Tax=Saprolegnia diclina (strain VS20) TaxID=1156394 RepID=T0QR97_SAPDV|nr:hypothetical protein SDRG_05882 [Saprolegnia diclina VS20]EQC36425.1 hypothetical protein SDRG_05882 [Saprolegnia diclina VS20]|eukprot:XP_008609846.1 hypothetical protein SDRG_05882 [Saprolegnia diclina VS20]